MSTASRLSVLRLSVRLLFVGGLVAAAPAVAQPTTTAVASKPPTAVVVPAPVLPPAAVGPRWVPVPVPAGVTLKQVSVGSLLSIWALDTTGTLWQYMPTGWTKKGCCAVGNISATADGALWGTHPPNLNRVLRWSGTRWDENFPAGVVQVAGVNSRNVWGLDGTGMLHFLVNNAWEKKGCCVTQIAVANDGSLWATHPPNLNRVLRWNGTRWDENLPTGMVYITAGSASNVWGLDGADRVFKLNGAAWQAMPGSLHNISAGADGTVWGVDGKGLAYRWVPK